MGIEAELITIDNALAELEFRILDDGVGGSLSSRDEASFRRLRIEAKTILDLALGIANNFSLNFHFSPSASSSLAAVQECRGLIHGAVNHIRRELRLPPNHPHSQKRSLLICLGSLHFEQRSLRSGI